MGQGSGPWLEPIWPHRENISYFINMFFCTFTAVRNEQNAL